MIQMTAAKVSHPPIVRVRFSASGLPRSSFLVHAPGTATMSSPVSKRTICIKRIVIRSLLLYHLLCAAFCASEVPAALRQKSEKTPFFRTRGRVHMEHIRPTHASMRIRLCSMLTFAFANIISSFLRCLLRIRSYAGTSNMNSSEFIIS